ncbi:DUF7572 family protein [Gordonia westfalica]|uniref:DUF7572 domain-containing protein n=1 Tax=Gordonia westfalica TaxID=158898 RepID=A0A1H2DRJ9_9ACTN|nr:hypothetical protein [Gordonia westfalica]SDT85391.1 hypothetical protein SAMN04488548_1192 [Gordonia westfalica]
MKPATLVAEALPHMPPITNLYSTEDGFLLVLVVEVPDMTSILTSMECRFRLAVASETDVSVFLSDERGQVIDYDGDPANGLTPILSTDSKSFAMTINPTSPPTLMLWRHSDMNSQNRRHHDHRHPRMGGNESGNPPLPEQ